MSSSHGGDPLRAMYFIAAVLMFLASAVVVAMMFVPGGAARSAAEDVWTPGSGDAFTPLGDPAAVPERTEVPEDLHQH